MILAWLNLFACLIEFGHRLCRFWSFTCLALVSIWPQFCITLGSILLDLGQCKWSMIINGRIMTIVYLIWMNWWRMDSSENVFGFLFSKIISRLMKKIIFLAGILSDQDQSSREAAIYIHDCTENKSWSSLNNAFTKANVPIWDQAALVYGRLSLVHDKKNRELLIFIIVNQGL